ncbi:metallothionein-2 [Ceratitis capitata]|uniref:metallothionein-2 n=1 Tax=Ceratitis capitata TaxID=7213 RepID=UPI0003299481|nr:metallothionein-2 [Ceratitis capitata]
MPCKGCEKDCKCTPDKCDDRCKCAKDAKCHCHGGNVGKNAEGTTKSCCSAGGGEKKCGN